MIRIVRIAGCAALALGGTAVLYHVVRAQQEADAAYEHAARAIQEQSRQLDEQVVLFTQSRVAAGATMAASLELVGLEASTAAGVAGSAQSAFDLRQFRAGNSLWVGRSLKGALREVRYQIDADRMLRIEANGARFAARVEAIPSRTDVTLIAGTIENSLFQAVQDAGGAPEVAVRMAQIFGWDLDFYADPRVGDTFKVVIEKKTYTDGQTAGYGMILAAEYVNAGRTYQAVLFHDATGSAAYYKPDGGALQKAFLRSPLKFAAPITSHFSMSRFHPILKEYRPHLGVDYGAPIGTPVQTIGNGKVIFASYSGGSGNLIRIQHSNGYETQYMHLSKILVRVGQHVQAGERIGLVGQTGLATGPHLDFRILQNGTYRNFETLHLPPAEPVAQKDMPEFAAARDQWMPLLDKGAMLEARAR